MERGTYLGLLSLAAAYFTLGVGSLAVIGLVEPMSRALAATPAGIANLVTAFALTFAVCAPLAQVVLGHWPRRRLLLAGLAIMSVSAALGALVSDYWVVLATRVTMGAGAAMVGPMASAIGAGLVVPQQQGRALSVVFSGMTLGSFLAGAVHHSLGAKALPATSLLLAGAGAAFFLSQRGAIAGAQPNRR